MKKKILHIALIPCIIIITAILYLSYLSNTNQNYLDSITKKIKENYQINEDITYANQYGNYYVFTTKSEVIVLNKEYEEILKENIASIKTREENMELIYKTNQLMYETKEVKDKVLTYKYYDAKTNDFIKETIMEQK